VKVSSLAVSVFVFASVATLPLAAQPPDGQAIYRELGNLKETTL
jgi:hypothetical protein